MAKLIGNYTLEGQDTKNPSAASAAQPEIPAADASASEFERRAMARLGGSIAFVMKGKNVLWTGGAKS
jgi:hypothetical protein